MHECFNTNSSCDSLNKMVAFDHHECGDKCVFFHLNDDCDEPCGDKCVFYLTFCVVKNVNKIFFTFKKKLKDLF